MQLGFNKIRFKSFKFEYIFVDLICRYLTLHYFNLDINFRRYNMLIS